MSPILLVQVLSLDSIRGPLCAVSPTGRAATLCGGPRTPVAGEWWAARWVGRLHYGLPVLQAIAPRLEQEELHVLMHALGWEDAWRYGATLGTRRRWYEAWPDRTVCERLVERGFLRRKPRGMNWYEVTAVGARWVGVDLAEVITPYGR